ALSPVRERDLEAGRDEREAAGRERERRVLGHGRTEVEAGRVGRGVGGKVEALPVREDGDRNVGHADKKAPRWRPSPAGRGEERAARGRRSPAPPRPGPSSA